MDEKKNVKDGLEGMKSDIDDLANEALADSKSAAESEADKAEEAVAGPDASAASVADTSDKAESEDTASDAAAQAEASADAVTDTIKDTAPEETAKAEKLTEAAAEKTTASAKDATTAVKEDKPEKKPVAKVDPQYDKIFWPPAGKVWSNTLTVIIVAALMAGTIFLVDLGLRAIIDGFMSI